jgi:hypothetical protein
MFLSTIKMQIMDKRWNSIELFAGCGGLALGFELAGIDAVMLDELNKDACATLRTNRPTWNVQQCSIADVDFSPHKGTVDVISGGFPCQSFSYAGRKRGLEDVRGTLFFEFARAIKEAQPMIQKKKPLTKKTTQKKPAIKKNKNRSRLVPKKTKPSIKASVIVSAKKEQNKSNQNVVKKTIFKTKSK